MKICPKCQKSYADDNLNFCLEDGTILQQQTAASAMPDTVLLNQARPTAPTQQPYQNPQQPAWNTGAAQPQQQYSMQPPAKSSKAWLWVLGILALVVILCGGGIVGFFFYAASQGANLAANTSTSPTPGKNPFGDKNTNSSSTTTTSSDRKDVETLDLKEWVRPTSLYGNTEYVDGELLMSSKNARFYYVLAGTEDQKSVNADVSLIVRNVDNKSTNLGYGLVFHSNPTPLQQGYALLLDSTKKRYRVVHHTPSNEAAVINWTKDDSILDGTQPNKLEIRDKTDKIEIYINDKMVNSIKNVYGYPGGVVGLYTADAIKIGFKDLTIRK